MHLTHLDLQAWPNIRYAQALIAIDGSMTPKTSRFRYALRWALGHLTVSLVVAALGAFLVFGLWYPAPWRQLLGVAGIFGLVVVVDVVCGPLLTLVLASPRKSRRERWVDLSLVASLQLAALAYGLWSVHGARPVILAFEVDRFVVITANEVQTEQLQAAPTGLQGLPWAGVHRVAVRKATSSQEFLESVDASLQGVSTAMRPGWWRPFEEARPEIARRAKPLAELLARRADQTTLLEAAAADTGLPNEELRYLPLTSSKQLDWVALLNPSGDIVGHAPVDGFD